MIRIFEKQNVYKSTTDLFDHFVAEDLIAVEDLDGDEIAGVDVLRELNFPEASLAQGPSQFVLPHAHAHARGRVPRLLAHSLLLKKRHQKKKVLQSVLADERCVRFGLCC